MGASVTCPQCERPVRAGALYCGGCGVGLPTITPPTRSTYLTRNRASPRQTGEELLPGTLLGMHNRYQIDCLLGRGGFGQAYRAYDTQLQRYCVLKRMVLHPAWGEHQRQVMRQNFQREARLRVTLNSRGHPHIPDIYEYLDEDDCLVMKYIEGQHLGQVLDGRTTPLPIETALRYARDICSALVYMHSHTPEPVLHRDIKPSNLMTDREGRVWLIDFGIAREHTVTLSQNDPHTTLPRGTPGFTPPEQWGGAAEPRSDVYALATTLRTLLTKVYPDQEQRITPAKDATQALSSCGGTIPRSASS
jgi:serine/threonine protein kinase